MTTTEIDELIATKIFHWNEKYYAGGDGGVTYWTGEDGSMMAIKKDFSMLTVFSPSTKMDDAMHVLDYFNSVRMDVHKDGRFLCRVFKEDYTHYSAEEETMPMAICTAALKSIGIDIGKQIVH